MGPKANVSLAVSLNLTLVFGNGFTWGRVDSHLNNHRAVKDIGSSRNPAIFAKCVFWIQPDVKKAPCYPTNRLY